MYFAHIIGEHHHESFLTGVMHAIFSWTGLIISIIVSLIIGQAIYLHFRKKTAKEQIKK